MNPCKKPSAVAGGPARPGTTRAGSLAALPLVLQQLGQPIAPLLASVGLPETLFDNPDTLVDLFQRARLLDLAAEKAGCPHLGLLCGAMHRPETIGLAGRLARNARDVGSALRGLTLNLHLNGHAFVPTLTLAGTTAEFGMHLVPDLPGPSRVTVDLGMAAAFSIVRALCGPGWAPLEVLLVHGPGGSRRPYDQYYGVPVRFGSDRNSIAFPARWLTEPVQGADAASLALLERELAVLEQQQALPPAVATRRALLACMARGDLSVRAVAAALGLHARTLNRRLAGEGTSVFALTKEVRYRVARDLLANTALPVTEIAATLLYGNIGAFTRAFREWSGVAPSVWRERNGRGPVG